jgi:hypothetical protein
MKIRTAIVAFTLLAGSAATTFAGERGRTDARDSRDENRHGAVVRHDDLGDARHEGGFGHDADFRRDHDLRRDDFPVVRYDPSYVIGCER